MGAILILLVLFLPFFLLIKYGNADRFTQRWAVNKNAQEVMHIFEDNIRDVSILVKTLLLLTNVIYPSNKNWAGKIDRHSQTCEIMRIPRWYDLNPFSLKITCEVQQHHQQSIILVKPLFTRKSLFGNYLIVWGLSLLLQSIQTFMGDMWLLNVIDTIQALLIGFFPVAFYIEWRVSQKYLQKLFDNSLVIIE